MKRKTFPIIIFVLLVGLAVSNPNMEDFKMAAERELDRQLEEQSQLEQALGDLFGGTVSQLLASRTKRKNYVFWSVYTFEFDGEEYSYVGIATQFIPLQKELPLQNE